MKLRTGSDEMTNGTTKIAKTWLDRHEGCNESIDFKIDLKFSDLTNINTPDHGWGRRWSAKTRGVATGRTGRSLVSVWRHEGSQVVHTNMTCRGTHVAQEPLRGEVRWDGFIDRKVTRVCRMHPHQEAFNKVTV